MSDLSYPVPPHPKKEANQEKDDALKLKRIARISSDFPTKFGIPRQSGLVPSLESTIIMEPEYRDPLAFRGIEDYTHLWLIWEFSEAVRETWSPTVHPPRLGSHRKMGVFATRSPFRPNALGLSSVRFLGLTIDKTLGPLLHVSGADLMDGTPIYDIKPYLPFTDSHPEASAGFAGHVFSHRLQVVFPEEKLALIPKDKRQALLDVLAEDPRPAYQNDPTRVYGVEFLTFDVRFRVEGDTLIVEQVVEA